MNSIDKVFNGNIGWGIAIATTAAGVGLIAAGLMVATLAKLSFAPCFILSLSLAFSGVLATIGGLTLGLIKADGPSVEKFPPRVPRQILMKTFKTYAD